MQRRRRGVDVGLILLLSQVFQVGLENIPPVTLGTLALNVFLFLKPLKPLLKVCISVDQSYYQKDWQRLLLAPVHHADDWHLYFNMVSLLWKGIKLERKLGSILFGYIIAVFSVLIGIVYIVLEYALAGLLNDPSYKMNCAVGFSGVLFALKVLNNHHHPGGTSNIMGIHVSSRYACWLELVAIHLCSPGTSFAGHLAGILVGLMYTLGPLKMLMKTTAGFSAGSHSNERRPYGFWFPSEQLSEEEVRRRRLNRLERWMCFLLFKWYVFMVCSPPLCVFIMDQILRTLTCLAPCSIKVSAVTHSNSLGLGTCDLCLCKYYTSSQLLYRWNRTVHNFN